MFVHTVLKLATQPLYKAGVVYAATRVVADVLVPSLVRRWNRRRALLKDAKHDLAVLNSHAVMHTDLAEFPSTVTMLSRKGLEPAAANSKEAVLRNNHKRFCAKWARAAKARFEFARVCDDTPLNRAALHRWFIARWKELLSSSGTRLELHRMDLFLTDAIEMSFLPTAELMQVESKRAIRKRARMEFYNERKFVEGWK